MIDGISIIDFVIRAAIVLGYIIMMIVELKDITSNKE